MLRIYLHVTILLVLFLAINTGFSQEISVFAEVVNKKIAINYNLKGTNIDTLYTISLHYAIGKSKNFIYEPSKIKGDIGDSVIINGNEIKTIIWDIQRDEYFERFKDEFYTFKIKAIPYKIENKTNEIPKKNKENISMVKDLPWLEMALVEGGEFIMGNSELFFAKNTERPPHIVSLNSFFMSKYEISQAQWKLVMGEYPNSTNICDNCPVVKITWYDVQKFIERLNGITKFEYRLPTEAEWEFAARGGIYGPKTMSYSPMDDYELIEIDSIRVIGQKKENELGLYDMDGNAAEWCNDWYSGTYYHKRVKDNPKGPTQGEKKVYRSGLPKIKRDGYIPTEFTDYIGFRIVRN